MGRRKYALVVTMIFLNSRRSGGWWGEKGYLFFQNFMVSKYLKNRDLVKKRIDVCMLYDFLIFIVSLLA